MEQVEEMNVTQILPLIEGSQMPICPRHLNLLIRQINGLIGGMKILSNQVNRLQTIVETLQEVLCVEPRDDDDWVNCCGDDVEIGGEAIASVGYHN